ncbi:Nicotinamidase [Hondaea fermentalgiana]|uniref:Nicotinamidase n=1 Tax=Hondaea fermentalgiana TaxID=2315210 RepID=A0A2R5GF10_9STRA|nr:Nicotinamidase [Hondaea fermentalgiana]|eukprot:GBG28318.1 Nicotinamidase [Hondaea fermentalgiana]
MSTIYERNVPLERGGKCLLIIDPQNDFHPGGSLAIASADEDAERIAKMIKEHGEEIREIYVTLDTHMKYHIAHQMFWTDGSDTKKMPDYFTTITLSDFKNGVWKPARNDPGLMEWVETYLQGLESEGRMSLTIWPEHCLVGSTGHAVRESIFKELEAWEAKHGSTVTYIIKGNNSYTEHYSALRAEVPREDDKNTQLNTHLIDCLKQHDEVLICGQAKSHCVNYTVRDLVENWDRDKMGQLVLIEDAMSPVQSFESEADAFIDDMKKLNLCVSTAEMAFSARK